MRRGWEQDGAGRMRYEPVRGSYGTVSKKIHPKTLRLLFHAMAWNALSVMPLVDLWTTDRTEAHVAVEDVFR